MTKLSNKSSFKKKIKSLCRTPAQAIIFISCILIALIILLSPAIVYLSIRLEVL